MTGNGRRPPRGFSLLELLIVVTMVLAVAAIAVPQVVNATQSFRLRSAGSGLSGLIQKCRMQAVARNGFYSVAAVKSGATVFVDLDSSGTINQAQENATVLQMPARMVIDSGSAHPSDASINNGLVVVYSSLPRFNPRGIPCFISSGVCKVDTSKMYISYVRQDRTMGGTGWAAVTITPAGRIRMYTWNGTNWQ